MAGVPYPGLRLRKGGEHAERQEAPRNRGLIEETGHLCRGVEMTVVCSSTKMRACGLRRGGGYPSKEKAQCGGRSRKWAWSGVVISRMQWADGGRKKTLKTDGCMSRQSTVEVM